MTTGAIAQAVSYLQQGGPAPAPADVIAALLAAEKQSKQAKQRYDYEQLLGSWQLGLVSGTQKKRSKPGAKPTKVPGKGRFLPKFLTITITYAGVDREADSSSQKALGAGAASPGGNCHTVKNSVSVGGLQLQLTGPTRFWPKTNSLGFDFTAINASIGPLTLYSGKLRGGEAQAQRFESQSLKEQAFFTFFAVEERYIAARGKGGGLALWTRSPSSPQK